MMVWMGTCKVSQPSERHWVVASLTLDEYFSDDDVQTLLHVSLHLQNILSKIKRTLKEHTPILMTPFLFFHVATTMNCAFMR